MKPGSLGLIETLGMTPAIEAADAGAKAANVEFAGYETVRAGLITVKFLGDVAAVNVAVSAGTAAATRVGTVVARHVIARPDPQVRNASDQSSFAKTATAEPVPSSSPMAPAVVEEVFASPETAVEVLAEEVAEAPTTAKIVAENVVPPEVSVDQEAEEVAPPVKAKEESAVPNQAEELRKKLARKKSKRKVQLSNPGAK